MKALSVKPFFAWAIIYGGKDVENRTWRTNHRGRILIHASNYRSQDELEASYEATRKVWPACPDPVPTSGIIGSVEIIDCIEDSTSSWAYPDSWHWVLARPVPTEYKECKGKLGLWHASFSIQDRR